MYCPRCAKEFTPDTSYCRTCGLELGPVSELVNGDLATAPEVRSRPNFKLFRIGFGIFILGMVVGLLNGALKGFGLFPDEYGKFVFLSFIAAGMLCLGAGFVFPKKYYVKKKRKEQLGEAETPALTTGKFEGLPSADRNIDIAQPVSITERTTRNLR
jgi:hypothetical protein